MRRQQYPDIAARRSRPALDAALIARFFRRHAILLRRVPPATLKEMARACILRRYAAGQFVCRTGDPATEVWVVLEGRLCVNQCGWKGNRLSIEIMVPGDVSGLAAVACQTYPGEVQATRETVLIVIPRQAIVRQIERDPVLAREILYAYAQRLQYIETLLYLSRETVEKRLAAAMLYLYHKFGFTLPLSRAELGDMAGTTPETTMRVLKSLSEKGLVERRRGKLLIRDLKGLKAVLVGVEPDMTLRHVRP